MARTLTPLATRYSVVTVDLAGSGASGATRQNVAAVVARLPNAHVVLVGDGMGGPVALQAAP